MPPILHHMLRLTAFKNPLLGTLVPSVALAYGIQTAVAIPSIAAQTERFYDFSGSLTYLSCTAFSLALPFLRAKAAGSVPASMKLGEYLGVSGGGGAGGLWSWRQLVFTAAVGVWSARLGSFLLHRITSEDGRDSRFDDIRSKPLKFYAVWLAQATWVSLCSLPVIALNSLPRSAFTTIASSTSLKATSNSLATTPYWTDILGLAVFIFGFLFEVTADAQKSRWSKERKEKKHSEEFLTRGLWSTSRHPNYFGEITLWSGIAFAAATLLVRSPAQTALGLSGGTAGKMLVTGMCAASPAFVSFLLLKVSGVPLSENKYDKKFGDRKEYKEWKENTPMLVPKFW